MNSQREMINVEVVYGNADKQNMIKLQLLVPATVLDAITISNILTLWPEIDLAQQKVGILSKIVALETPLKNHDRVEIYRPLIIDPKDARRKRLKKKT